MSRLDYAKIADSHPSLARGRVWCLKCGFTYSFAAAGGLERGWPKCCGQTMAIDSPEEWVALDAQRSADGALGRQDGPTDQAHDEHLPLSPDQTPPEGG